MCDNRYCDLRLREADGQGNSPAGPRKTIVFIHGIVSSHATFVSASAAVLKEARLANCEVLWFDYKWQQGIDLSGKELADCLAGFDDNDQVVLVCHSMGGLVARCFPPRPIKAVKMVIQIGTPNRGAADRADGTAIRADGRNYAARIWLVSATERASRPDSTDNGNQSTQATGKRRKCYTIRHASGPVFSRSARHDQEVAGNARF